MSIPFDPATQQRIIEQFERAATHSAINIMQTVFPVAAFKRGTGELSRPDFFGTAFAVAPNIFITAAHVWRSAEEIGDPCLGGYAGNDSPMGVATIEAHELFDELDVAVLRTHQRLPVTALTSWLGDRVQVLTDVSAFGYPHAVTLDYRDEKRFNVVFRAFKGHVITTRGWERLQNEPAIYEVSTPFPEGLSGAPLLWSHDNHLVVVGIVMGRQTIEYGGDSERAGVAIIVDQLLDRTSTLLDGVFHETLRLDLFRVGYPSLLPGPKLTP